MENRGQISKKDIIEARDVFVANCKGEFGDSLDGEEITDKDTVAFYQPISGFIGHSHEEVTIPAIDFVTYAGDVESAEFIDRHICLGEKIASLYIGSDSDTNRKLYYAWPEPKGNADSNSRDLFSQINQEAEEAVWEFLRLAFPNGASGHVFESLYDEFSHNLVTFSFNDLVDAYSLGDEVDFQRAEKVYNLVIELLQKREAASESLMSWSNDHFIKHGGEYEGVQYECYLARGVTLFGVALVRDGLDFEWAPAINEDDLYVEIRFSKKLSVEDVKRIFNAYLYEAISVTGLRLHPTEHPQFELGTHLYEPAPLEAPSRLRPLKFGAGMDEIYKIFIKANETSDTEIKLVFLTQVIEYVSATVIRINAIESISAKLRSRRALDPNADFVLELQDLVERLRDFRGDNVAIREAVRRCCTAREVLAEPPDFLRKYVKAIDKAESKKSIDSKEEEALEAFADSLYATRNQVAHAKANYNARGNECPEDELETFVACVQTAADQVIQWYANRPAHERITNSPSSEQL